MLIKQQQTKIIEMNEEKSEKVAAVTLISIRPIAEDGSSSKESPAASDHQLDKTKPTRPERRNRKKPNKTVGMSQADEGSKDNPVTSGDAGMEIASTATTSVRKIDIQTRIKRVKNKLARQTQKCQVFENRHERFDSNEFNPNGRKQRSQSERETFHHDSSMATTSVRSMSFSSTSTTRNRGRDLPASNKHPPTQKDEPGVAAATDNDFPGERDKRNRGRRGKKKSTSDSGKAEYALIPSKLDGKEFVLDREAFLLLDLLFMEPRKRERYIFDEARRKDLIVPDQNGGIRLNPKLLQWNEPPFRIPVRECAELLGIGTAGGPIAPKRIIFEDFVNEVVQNELPEEQQKDYELPRTTKRQRIRNYIKSAEFEANLETYAQRLVDANLGIIVEEELRVSAKNNDHAFVKMRERERDAMFSTQLVRKFAMHGDVVRAFVRIPKKSAAVQAVDTTTDAAPTTDLDISQPIIDPTETIDEESAVADRLSRGFVIKVVKEMGTRRVVGNFLSYRKNSKFITFVPRDMRAPNIRIFQEHWPESFKSGSLQHVGDMLYVAEIIDWCDEICIGRIIQPIGKCGELDSENRAILLQNNLKFDSYDEKFNKMFEGEFVIDDAERERREDLRSECIFTIDPLTARDLDDAMSCKELFDGNFEVGVHISDVSYFLPEECELDQIVKTRTTSVYMVNEVFHMLPKPLCMRCSLLPGDDKLAFSVFWIISPNAEIISTRFTRSVIRSCTQFAYQHAQLIIDNPQREFNETDFPQIHNGYGAPDVVRVVRKLHEFATILRNKRFDNGALKIDKPKIYFDLDPKTGAPIAFRPQEQSTANFMIEEFMLLANQSVAEFIYEKFPSISVLRNHQAPFRHMMKRVKEHLQKAGMTLDISSSKSVFSSIQQLIAENENPDAISVALSQLVSKPMMRARYFCSDAVDYESFWHYALSIPIYTHFTSPIRRYPDVLVHRVLSAALDYTAAPKRTPPELQELAEKCNDGKYNAKLAGDDSINLYFLHYIKNKGPLVLRAVVVEVFTYSFEAILLDTGHALSISFRNCSEAKLEVTKVSGVTRATVSFPSMPEQKPFEIKTCTEVWLAVTVKSKRIRGQIVPAPLPDGKVILPKEVQNESSDDEAENEERKEIFSELKSKSLGDSNEVLNESIEVVAKSASVIEESTPAVKYSVPAVESPAPVVKTPALAVEQTAPAVESPALAVEKAAPAVESPALSVEKTAPAVENPAPVVETLALAVEKTAPALESPASAIESPASAMESPAPAVESPASVTEATAETVQLQENQPHKPIGTEPESST